MMTNYLDTTDRAEHRIGAGVGAGKIAGAGLVTVRGSHKSRP